jgi:hypothetical protein
MALSDILTNPFLIYLGITLVLIGGIGFFLMQRIQEQNHKISSMFELVNSVVEEMNFIKGRLQMMSYVTQNGGTPQNVQQTSELNNEPNVFNNLISVSDDSEDESDDNSENDDSDSDSDSDGDNSVEEKHFIELSQEQNIKVINFDEITNNNELEEFSKLNDNGDDDNDDDNDEDDDSDPNDSDDERSLNEESKFKNDDNTFSSLKIIDVNLDTDIIENLDVEEIDTDNKTNSNANDFDFTKTISIIESNLEDSGNVIDYKKMSLNKLKEIAIFKGLITENSKATKSAILKMLNSE